MANQDNPVLSAIDYGVATQSSDIAVYFAADGERIDIVENMGEWSPYAREQAMAALATYAAVADLSFRVTDDAEEATFRLTKSPSVFGSLGFMNPPDPAFGDAQGIAWFNSGPYWGGAESGILDPGSYMYTIFLHEFGHGLGLAHSFEEGGASTVMPAIGPGLGLDQGIYTVMTYNDGWPEAPEGLPDSRAWGWNLGPSAIDIAVLQAKYGANLETATGDTRYILPAADGPGTGYRAIWDAGGRDTLVHRGGADAVIDLRAATLRPEEGGGGFVSHVEGVHGGFTIANGVVIEKAIGGAGDDALVGNGARNVLFGRDGDDTLDGRGGADRLVGGEGDDVYVIDARDRVIERAGEGHDLVETRGIDVDLTDFAHVEDVALLGRRDLSALGEEGANHLWGNAGANRLEGRGGPDWLEGGRGADTLLGGAGEDTLLGGRGADVLTGGADADTFVFAPRDGRDTVTDFEAADVLDLTAFALASYEVLEEALVPVAAGTGIMLPGMRLLLEGFAVSDMAEDLVLI